MTLETCRVVGIGLVGFVVEACMRQLEYVLISIESPCHLQSCKTYLGW
jgi:hypothetical protein